MSSKLIISSVANLQLEIIKTIKNFAQIIGVYVSLNKPQRSTEEFLKSNKVDTDKIFFIDCVTSDTSRDDVLHVKPQDLETLGFAIENFINEIKGQKFLIIDALSTLLIYNDENKVAAFVKKITEYSSKKEVMVIAFSPKTKGEELLNKIFNFFDNVEKTPE